MSLNRTFVAGLTPTTASDMNGLQAPWDAYGSAASFTASTTNPVLGDGTWVGRALQIGKTWKFWALITMGPATTYGSGTYKIALPAAPFAGHPGHFDAYYFDSSTPSNVRGITFGLSGSTVFLGYDGSAAGGGISTVTETLPWAWAVGDSIAVWGEFEAA